MDTHESTPVNTLYEIEHESYAGKGPFTGADIDAMVQSGEIPKNQKVRKVHTGKVIEARYALVSAQLNDRPPSAPTKGKLFAGILLLLAGLGAIVFSLYAKEEGERVRGKVFIIPALLVIGGAKMVAGNAKSLKAGQGGGLNGSSADSAGS